jgi:hypothetical protein
VNRSRICGEEDMQNEWTKWEIKVELDWENMKGCDLLVDLGVYRRIIFKWKIDC